MRLAEIKLVSYTTNQLVKCPSCCMTVTFCIPTAEFTIANFFTVFIKRSVTGFLRPSSCSTLQETNELSLLETCPNWEFFLVRIFPYSDWIQIFTMQISLFSPNTRKYGPVKLWIRTFFKQCIVYYKFY